MEAKAELVFVTPSAEAMIAKARWVCRRSEKPGRADNPEEVGAAVRACLKTGHLTPLEFASATFDVHCSRVCSHQLVRHRTFAFCQESQRSVASDDLDHYHCAETTMAGVTVEPPVCALALVDKVANHYNNTARLYDILLDCGVKKEMARYVLTNMTPTRLWMTANFRNWAHFLRLRLHPIAQQEIRELAQQIQKQLETMAPNVFSTEALASMLYAPTWVPKD